MKKLLPSLITAIALAAVTSANAQSLGAAANYDIFVTNDGKIELKGVNDLFGQVGYSNGSTSKNENVTDFQGAVYVHTGANFEAKSGFNPSGGLFRSGFDSQLDQANVDVVSYANYLNGLISTATFGKQETAFSFSTTQAVSVIDFNEVKLKSADFSLTGRSGGNDVVIIRIHEQIALEGGASVNLTNLDAKNVVWYLGSDKEFNLHKGGGDFFGSIIALDGKVTLGEVNFTGTVYGKELKLGSSVNFQTSVPEPSSTLMIFFGAASLLLVRRRKR